MVIATHAEMPFATLLQSRSMVATSLAVERPLVTVGLPTYNRVGTLPRAVDSVLSQAGVVVDLVICDNASTDGTEAYCRTLAARDGRVRYLRQSTNVGPTPNFRRTLAEATGEFFMWLSDDDWLGPGYLAECVAALRISAQVVGAVGAMQVYGHPQPHLPGACSERSVRLDHPRAADRIVAYLRSVRQNSQFYAVWRRDILNTVPFPNAWANDTRVVAALLARGPLAIAPNVTIHKTYGGTSADVERNYRVLGLEPRRKDHDWLFVGLDFMQDIAWRVSAYRSLSLRERATLLVAAPDALWTRDYVMPDWWWHYRLWRSRILKLVTRVSHRRGAAGSVA